MINTMRDVVHKWQRQHGLSIHPDAIDDLVQQVKAAMTKPCEYEQSERLIDAAPAMARMLLESETSSAQCFSCGVDKQVYPHKLNCELVAVLRAAGVLE